MRDSSKPIRVFYSELSGRFYASRAYRTNGDGTVTITGQKYDVTSDIGAAVARHEIVFLEAERACSRLATPASPPREEASKAIRRITKREVDAFCGEYKDAAECEVDDEGRDASHEYFDPHRRAIRIALEAFVASPTPNGEAER